jgi:hypothetical protein
VYCRPVDNGIGIDLFQGKLTPGKIGNSSTKETKTPTFGLSPERTRIGQVSHGEQWYRGFQQEAQGPSLEEERTKTEISEKTKRKLPECCTGK